MFIFYYVISSSGELIYPNELPTNKNLNSMTSPSKVQVTLVFYDAINTSTTGIVTPTDPVTTGLSGTVTIQARTTTDSVWSDIQDGALDLSSGDNMAFPSGSILQVKAICSNVAGCNYILVRMDMGV